MIRFMYDNELILTSWLDSLPCAQDTQFLHQRSVSVKRFQESASKNWKVVHQYQKQWIPTVWSGACSKARCGWGSTTAVWGDKLVHRNCPDLHCSLRQGSSPQHATSLESIWSVPQDRYLHFTSILRRHFTTVTLKTWISSVLCNHPWEVWIHIHHCLLQESKLNCTCGTRYSIIKQIRLWVSEYQTNPSHIHHYLW